MRPATINLSIVMSRLDEYNKLKRFSSKVLRLTVEMRDASESGPNNKSSLTRNPVLFSTQHHEVKLIKGAVISCNNRKSEVDVSNNIVQHLSQPRLGHFSNYSPFICLCALPVTLH